MIYPIYVIGHPVLRKKTEEISENYPDLEDIINNMFETMYASDGVGLAAPQVGMSIRLFVVDASPLAEDKPELKDFKRIFINPKIVERSKETIMWEEGCLSIPGINENVKRNTSLS